MIERTRLDESFQWTVSFETLPLVPLRDVDEGDGGLEDAGQKRQRQARAREGPEPVDLELHGGDQHDIPEHRRGAAQPDLLAPGCAHGLRRGHGRQEHLAGVLGFGTPSCTLDTSFKRPKHSTESSINPKLVKQTQSFTPHLRTP